MWGIIIVLVALWAGAMLSRNTLRAYWWTHRLASAGSAQERLSCFHRLSALGSAAVPAVSRLLTHEDPGLRSFAVGVLQHAGSVRATELLMEACHDDDEDVARLAIQGVALTDDERAVTLLTAFADQSTERRAMMATAALADLGSSDASRALIELLQTTKHTGVRVEAIESLGQLRSDEAVGPLIDLLDDESVFDGVTERDRMILRAFEVVRLRPELAQNGTTAQTVEVDTHHVVWQSADRALRLITNHVPDQPVAQGATRTAIAEAWREWSARTRQKPDTVSP
jgi:hypothetical protein